MKKIKNISTFLFLAISLNLFAQNGKNIYEKGLELVKIGEYEKALLTFNDAERNEFNESDLYFQRAICYTFLMKYNEALIDFNKTLKLNENNIDALYYRGLVRNDLKEFNNAIEDLLKCFERDSTFSKALLKAGKVYLYGLNDFDNSIKILEKFTNIENENSDGFCYLGLAYGSKYNSKDLKKGIKFIDRAIELDNSNSFYFYTRGFLYYDSKNLKKALLDFDKAIEINPNYSQAYFERGNIYYDYKNYLEQIKNYDKAIEIEPKNGRYYYWRGQAKLKQYLEKEKACEDFKISISLGYEEAKKMESICKLKGRTYIITE